MINDHEFRIIKLWDLPKSHSLAQIVFANKHNLVIDKIWQHLTTSIKSKGKK